MFSVNCPKLFTPHNVMVHVKMNSYYWSSVRIYPVAHTRTHTAKENK